MAPAESSRPSQRHRESGTRAHHHRKRRPTTASSSSRRGATPTAANERRGGLSADALAQLNNANSRHRQVAENERYLRRAREERRERDRERERDRRRQQKQRRSSAAYCGEGGGERGREDGEKHRRHHRSRSKKRRVVSGAILEEGRSRGITHVRGGAGGSGSSNDSVEKENLYYEPAGQPWWKNKRILILGAIAVVILIIIIAVAVAVSKNKSSSSSSDPKSSSLGDIPPGSIPSGAPSWLDPFQWADTTDFNLTYTNETVGSLPVMGLNTSWDDSKAANGNTPPLNKPWGSYATLPARGVNLGGWLSLEPFITPSLFNYDPSLGVIDEWTLCTHLGSKCAGTLEQHYASFVTEQTFAEMADAGLDHVRIPYSYWAVEVYDGDPYVFRTSWRYLLRGIEWARRYGLRVNLDLHGLPGSQNGWNHSGRQGPIGWMNGTDGATNVQRSLDVHDKLSQFFAQDRYRNVISHYGLANEPRMTFLSVQEVMNWTQQAASLVRKNGVSDAIVVFGDGFCGLDKWQGQPNTDNLALDVHQYVIFNNAQIVFSHADKIRYACQGWTQQTQQSMDTSTGFGPTIVAEWSQADTDCAQYLGNVGNGNRWTGTYNVGNATLDALTPRCPTTDARCECADANADPGQYSAAYKQFLLTFAEAQMYSFEKGWGWWYWTWDTESAPQWSYKQGLAAGILPQKAYQRTFQCDLTEIPDFSGLPEVY